MKLIGNKEGKEATYTKTRLLKETTKNKLRNVNW
jgi:hypothetical protein